MARNWKFGEAVRAIQSGNKEDIMDIGRRFPLFANLAAQVNEAGMQLIDCVPEYCTARKIESVLKGDVQETEADEEVAEETPDKEPAKAEKKAPAKKEKEAKKPAKAAKKEEEAEGDDLESKSAKELFDMCKEAGLKVKPKQDKAVYIEALKAANESEAEDDWDEEEEEAPAPKKPAKTEKKAPAKKAPKEEDEDDDWDI